MKDKPLQINPLYKQILNSIHLNNEQKAVLITHIIDELPRSEYYSNTVDKILEAWDKYRIAKKLSSKYREEIIQKLIKYNKGYLYSYINNTIDVMDINIEEIIHYYGKQEN